MTELYRHFNGAGRLLYVGVSLSTLRRLSEHKSHSHWFDEITLIKVERFATREAVLTAERKAILEEDPLHNLKRLPVLRQSKLDTNIEASKQDLTRRIVQFNPLYSVSEAAEALGVPNAFVTRLIKTGAIGHVAVPYGQKFRFKITGWQLIEYIEAWEQETKCRCNEK